ncbi:DUF3320 domain-containing protein [Sphaerotilus natans]|uniref:DUF3320 domain-containing protein n=1 Tax=Sphaerotilus natans TaxID=34103 RepID=UPI00406D051B
MNDLAKPAESVLASVIAAVEDQPAQAELAPCIEVSAAGTLNLADFQNSVPLIHELKVVNETERHWSALVVAISSTPPFLQPREWRLDRIEAGEWRLIPRPDVALDGAMLARLTEAESAVLHLALRQESEQQEPTQVQTLHQQNLNIELLPRNQWGGLRQMPSMVAAFVQPNEPAVEHLLKQAAGVLRDNHCDAALNGYEGGARHAWEIASALWAAVSRMGLDYALPPASFEQRGQKIRGPQQVAETGLATCLDSTLLLCAALEQAGLHPLVVFTRGHAFAGVWLKREEFSDAVVDDVSALRKRMALNELVLFETTLLSHRPAPSFQMAVEHGARHLQEAALAEAPFELAVDVRRARLQRIRPLASPHAVAVPATPLGMPGDAAAPAADAFSMAPANLPVQDEASEDSKPQTPEDRLQHWQRKLLDLSLRNNLLNFRMGTRAVKVEAPQPAALEDLLARGTTIRLLPRPDLMTGADGRSQSVHEGRTLEDLRRRHAEEVLERGEVFIDLPKEDMETRLVELYRSARSALQEGGANTLFLALGFLHWHPDDKSATSYKAPLLLLPVKLERQSVRSHFSLSLLDDEPRFNATLAQMLHQDFRLSLKIDENDLPRDESGLDVKAVWDRVSAAVKDIRGWEVGTEVVLAQFSFAKYLMWKDLAERSEQLRTNAVVRHLLDTPRDPFVSDIAFPDPRRLDHEHSPAEIFCPLPADSSQLSAVMAASKGKDFVLIGPPGTGKSQTIANLIAQSLAEGRRVLFVSEKTAALDVVHRRLREVGLGEFCLELHSSKARKTDVLQQLQRAWDSRGEVDQAVWEREAQRLQVLKTHLNEHVERLHRVHRNGLTLFDAIGQVVAAEERQIHRVALSWPTPEQHDAVELAALRELAARLKVHHGAIDDLHSPDAREALALVGQGEWSPGWQKNLIESIDRVSEVVQRVDVAAQGWVQVLGLSGLPMGRSVRMALATVARVVLQVPGHDWRFMSRSDAAAVMQRLDGGMQQLARHAELSSPWQSQWCDEVLEEVRRVIPLLRRWQTLKAQLSVPWPRAIGDTVGKGVALLLELQQTAGRLSTRYDAAIEQLNVAQLVRDWDKAEAAVWPLSALGKRKISQQVRALTIGTQEPAVEADLRLLARLRELKAELGELPVDSMVGVAWQGARSDPARLAAVLRLQGILRAARQGDVPVGLSMQGLEPIVDGLCGEALAQDVERLQEMARLGGEIAGLSRLQSLPAEVWSGILSSDPDRLGAAVAFQSELATLVRRGSPGHGHEVIARGDCGPAMRADLDRLLARAQVERRLLEEGAHLPDLTGGLWAGLDTVAADVEAARRVLRSLGTVMDPLVSAGAAESAVRTGLASVLDGHRPGMASGTAARSYLETLETLAPAVETLLRWGGGSDEVRSAWSEQPLTAMAAQCDVLCQKAARLNAWCAWRRVSAEAWTSGLGPLVSAIEAGGLPSAGIVPTFDAAYARWWLQEVVDRDEALRAFVSADHERRIEDFRALDERFTHLTRDLIRARLCSRLPSPQGQRIGSEWGVLRKEMVKKTKHLPLRTLIEKTPTAMTSLAPCLLMSPLSVAQYLATGANLFDLVVFDEASQIPVWDAIGAIARARQVVMVGDPRQLPPTSFFGRSSGSAAEDDDAQMDDNVIPEDMESILDECLGANLPRINLSWHYRSRHESLIAFSNHHYYGGELVTFPSPVTEDQAVSFHPVPGVYARSGARTNLIEAQALVADLVGRLKTPGFVASRQTIGVVTFNAQQQRLIEDLLDEARRQDPSLEPYFAEAALEPVFVKNLESVQGDERDIMYFSTTYGPDATGALSMNFGPMNKTGGERRLNVAVTRARQGLRVFSSLQPEQINLGRTQARGVRDLKHFLAFAQRGAATLGRGDQGSLGGHDSPFEAAVAQALERRGWTLRTQVGVSSFRIDLAVVHPDAAGLYLTGIECDGATYHRSATARDRDRLREQVLRGLGWEIVRIWSTDWWIDWQGTLDRVHLRLQELLVRSREKRAAQAVLQQTSLVPVDVHDPVAEPVAYAGFAPALPSPSGEGVAQELADEARAPDDSSDIQREVARIVAAEGPIRSELLARRVVQALGGRRVRSAFGQRVHDCAAAAFEQTKESVGVFFWPTNRSVGTLIEFRGEMAWAADRGVEEICLHELAGLARDVAALTRDTEQQLRLMSQRLGSQRLTSGLRERLMEARALAACL